MKKKSAEQASRNVREVPQKIREYWWRLLVIVGLVGSAATAPFLLSDSADNSEVVNGHRVVQPEPSPAGEATLHRVVATPSYLETQDDEEPITPAPAPIPEPPAVSAHQTPAP